MVDGGGVVPVVVVGGFGLPVWEFVGRERQGDGECPGFLHIDVRHSGCGARGGDGAVDGGAGGLAEVVEEGRFDGLVAGGEHELELGAVLDVGANGPGVSGDGVDAGGGGR